jgi:hypothetical protein
MNLTKLLSIINLFRKGSAVVDKQAWKNGQITATAIAGAAMAGVQVAQAFGYDLPAGVTEAAVNAVAGAVATVVNIVGTYVTSEHVGLLPAKEELPEKAEGQ